MKLNTFTTRFPGVRWSGFALAAALVAVGAHAQNRSAVVGETTMVIGQATLVGADGSSRRVDRGMAVKTGDRIETQAGGHVHVRFVDGGRLSVRPLSRLVVENYAFSDAQRETSAIRFRLDEGVVRSITGAWGEAARDRFRLNTPVAAIGIKGTDFVVRADSQGTAAAVYSGAILMSPLTPACGATVGPCITGSERLLSEEMRGFAVEFSGQGAPQLVANLDVTAGTRRAPGAAPAAPTVVASSAPSVEVPTHHVAVVNDVLGADAAHLASLVPAPAGQLVWGRYVWVNDAGADTLSKSFDQAAEQGRELVAAGVSHALFREVTPGSSTLTTSEPNVAFRLNGSAATYQRYHDLGVEAASVTGGRLTIDFSRSTFSTELGVTSPSMGVQDVQASGTVSASGVFQTATGNARVLGGTSLDGREAAYLFEKSLNQGALRGITMWGR